MAAELYEICKYAEVTGQAFILKQGERFSMEYRQRSINNKLQLKK